MSNDLATIKQFLPVSIRDAQRVLARMERDIDAAETYEALRHLERMAEAIRVFYAEVDAVRTQAERAILLAEHRCGEELAKAPKAKGTRGQLIGRGVIIGAAPDAEPIPTIAEQVGSARRGHNLKALAAIPRATMLDVAATLHAAGKEATAAAVVKHVRAEAVREQREISRAATKIPNGIDWREGDCRIVLGDVPDHSAAAIITDPPWSREAEALYVWLADFAKCKLMLGGSLFAFVGKGWLDRVLAIFSARLTWRWQCEMRINPTPHYPGVNVQCCSTVIVWYSNGPLRPGLTLVDDLPSPHPDKSLHEWGQGSAAVEPIIEAKTKPGELIIDPFAGSGAFAFQAHEMGRRVICSDLVLLGSTKIAA
jgi:site-specific DNA-methyltransferase (adenine-specific)